LFPPWITPWLRRPLVSWWRKPSNRSAASPWPTSPTGPAKRWASRSAGVPCGGSWAALPSSRGRTNHGAFLPPPPSPPHARRAPPSAATPGPILDLYAATWQGQPLGPRDHILSADEKTSIQARARVHPPLPCGPGRPTRVEPEYRRGGAWQYLAAWDVRRGYVT